MNKITVIEAPHYEEARQASMADPIIQDMAKGLRDVNLNQLAFEDGTPRHEFMLAANREYRSRGGKLSGHLGAVPEALLRFVRSLREA